MVCVAASIRKNVPALSVMSAQTHSASMNSWYGPMSPVSRRDVGLVAMIDSVSRYCEHPATPPCDEQQPLRERAPHTQLGDNVPSRQSRGAVAKASVAR